MTQNELNRAIAEATGESVGEIAQRGFVELAAVPFERDTEDIIVDWDELDAARNVGVMA